jgi:hypothetical protein
MPGHMIAGILFIKPELPNLLAHEPRADPVLKTWPNGCRHPLHAHPLRLLMSLKTILDRTLSPINAGIRLIHTHCTCSLA